MSEVLEAIADALETRLEAAGVECEHLDDMVHEAASREASSTNNAGMHAQLYYLLVNGFTKKDILSELGVTGN